jgi:hypothetical protein
MLPDNITVLLLPSYSPELNPIENLWHYLRSHYLSNHAHEDYDALFDAGKIKIGVCLPVSGARDEIQKRKISVLNRPRRS